MDNKENQEYNSPDEQRQLEAETDKNDNADVSFWQDIRHVMGIKDKEVEREQQENQQVQEIQEIQEMPPPKRMQKRLSGGWTKKAVFSAAFMVAVAAGIILLPKLSEPKPPSPDVVASYNEKNITIEELKAFIVTEGSKDKEHYICEKHGFDHSLCDASEDCEKHPVDSLEGYKAAIQIMASEQIILDWAEAKGITQREDVRHEISDLFDNANVEEVVNQIYEQQLSPNSISKLDVQLYFDQNKEQYEGKNLSDVEAEIRQILLSQKKEDYFPKYIEELKKTAGLDVNYDLLKVDEPTNDEIKARYEQNQASYATERLLYVSEIVIDAAEGEEKAKEALRKIRSGENFEEVAVKYGRKQAAEQNEITADSSSSARETEANSLNMNEISDVIKNEDGSFSILRLDRIQESGIKKLKDVESDIRKTLLEEKQKNEYELRGGEVLFAVHGRRYTLGDFYREFLELPESYQKALNEYDGKKLLLDQLIVKELLLEKDSDVAGSESEQHDMEELKIQYLMQVMHEEEVEQKLPDPTEEEVQAFYETNKSSFVASEKVKMSVIWIAETEDGKGSGKAKEALAALEEGATFSETAKQYSEDATAEKGGVIDEWIYLEHIAPELASGIKNLAVGETSAVIESFGGFYIVQIDDKEEATQLTLEEVRASIVEHLKAEKHSELTYEMEKNILEESGLVVYDRTIKKMLKEQSGERKEQ